MKNGLNKFIFTILAVAISLSAFITLGVSAEAASKVKLSKSSVTIEQKQKATITLNNVKSKVNWTSSNKKVVKVVKSSGKNKNTVSIKAVAAGNTTVTAKVGSKKYNCKVSVKAPIKSISLNKSSIKISNGDTYTLKVNYKPSNVNKNKKIKWSSSNQKVATVTNGKVKAKNSGTTVITAKVDNKIAKCNVKVSTPLKMIKLSKTSATIAVGDSLKLTTTLAPTNADNKTIMWSSSNKQVLSVNNGTVKALKAGTATITAYQGNIKATCKITVQSLAIEEMPSKAISASITTSDYKNFYITIKNNTDKNMTINNGEGILAYNGAYNATLRSGQTSLYDSDISVWDEDIILKANSTTRFMLNTGYTDYFKTYTYNSNSEFIFDIQYKETSYCVGVNYYNNVTCYTKKMTEAKYEQQLTAYGIATIKENLKNPNSFTIIRMGKYYNKGKLAGVQIEYTATNSYGAAVTSHAYIRVDNQTTSLLSSTRSILTSDLGVVEVSMYSGAGTFSSYELIRNFSTLASLGNEIYLNQRYKRFV